MFSNSWEDRWSINYDLELIRFWEGVGHWFYVYAIFSYYSNVSKMEITLLNGVDLLNS